MSRVGKTPIKLTDGAAATISGNSITIKGPKGELSRTLPDGISVKEEDGSLIFTAATEGQRSRALHGLARALVAGMVEGVTKGFQKRLDVVGVSYGASVEGKRLKLNVGFSHPMYVDIPEGVHVNCPSATRVEITGCDKQAVGEFAAKARRTRPPEPYKGKGVRYVGEQIIQKAGKSFVGGGG